MKGTPGPAACLVWQAGACSRGVAHASTLRLHLCGDLQAMNAYQNKVKLISRHIYSKNRLASTLELEERRAQALVLE